MSFDTAVNIIGDVAVELGLVKRSAGLADAFGSPDPNIGQLCQFLKSVGRDLMRSRQWTALQNSWVFSTVLNQGRYALPADFDRVIDQTAWNRSNQLPVGGPLSPQEFQFMQARLVGISWNILYRLLQGKFQAYPADVTPGGYIIAYEYMSRWWVTPAGTQVPTAGPWTPNVAYSSATPDYVVSGGNIYRCSVSGTSGSSASPAVTTGTVVDGTVTWTYVSSAGSDAPTANGDTINFDPQLVRAALKLAWKAEKGMDVTSAAADYETSLERAINSDTLAPVLYFNRPTFAEPLLGPWSLPISGQTH